MFYHIGPRMLKDRKLRSGLKGNPMASIGSCDLCKNYLVKSVAFIDKMKSLYPGANIIKLFFSAIYEFL